MTNASSSGFSALASGSAETAWPRDGAKSTRLRPPSSLTNVTAGSASKTCGPAPWVAGRSIPAAAKRASMAANFSVSDGASKSVSHEGPSSSCSASSCPRIMPISSARLAYELNRARVLVLSRKRVPTDLRLILSPGTPGVPAPMDDSVSLPLREVRSSMLPPYRDPADARPKSERLSWRLCANFSRFPPDAMARLLPDMAFILSRLDLRLASCFTTMICLAL
mmetsp:Transcript_8188/g.37185  ORF Transcript_8188/g.37185 Transcript_8188/m.37185 type:complete len:223 (-) Transcript_8188:3060-3728(-)